MPLKKVHGPDGLPAGVHRNALGRWVYVVRPGDTLRDMALRLCGSAEKWKDILELNRDELAGPDALHPGMTLVVPERADWRAIESARQRAAQFMDSVRRRDLDALRNLSPELPEGWTAKALDDLPGKGFLGWYFRERAEMREEIVKALHQRYAEDTARMTTLLETFVADDFAGVYVLGPKGELNQCFFLTLQRRDGDWRVLTLDEARPIQPLSGKLQKNIEHYRALMREVETAKARLDTPRKLFEKIRELARAGRFDEIRRHVYPARHGEKAFADLAVEGIRTGGGRGDWAYSDTAIEALVGRYADKVRPADEEMLRVFRAEFVRIDPTLGPVAAERPGDIWFLDHAGCHILLIRTGGDFQLLFWEGLPKLAAAGAPRVGDPASKARAASTMTNLKTIRTIRSQLQLYKAQHGERWPDDFAEQMTMFTDADGNTNAEHTPVFRFGPYLMRIPANPYTRASAVTTVADPKVDYTPAADMLQGWWYNSATGEFRCHVPDAVVTPDGKQVNRM